MRCPGTGRRPLPLPAAGSCPLLRPAHNHCVIMCMLLLGDAPSASLLARCCRRLQGRPPFPPAASPLARADARRRRSCSAAPPLLLPAACSDLRNPCMALPSRLSQRGLLRAGEDTQPPKNARFSCATQPAAHIPRSRASSPASPAAPSLPQAPPHRYRHGNPLLREFRGLQRRLWPAAASRRAPRGLGRPPAQALHQEGARPHLWGGQLASLQAPLRAPGGLGKPVPARAGQPPAAAAGPLAAGEAVSPLFFGQHRRFSAPPDPPLFSSFVCSTPV